VRIENADVRAGDPGTPARIKTWVDQGIGVQGRPEWVFVKVHTHGAPEKQAASLLGEDGRTLHRELTTRYNDGVHWNLHYVTAREMYNIALAAMHGLGGNPDAHRDYVLPKPPVAS
jgi:phage gpG-like protein